MSADPDVVIIGAGPTGAAAAWRLATAGVSVTCLERGQWPDYDGLDRDAPDWEARRLRDWPANPNLRRRPEDYPVDDADSPIRPMIFNGVGGSTVMWTAHIPRFRRDDFRVHSTDGVGADWPIGYDDLRPWYELNERMLGRATVPGDPAAPDVGAIAAPPRPLGRAGARIAAAFDRLGWHWWPVDLVVGDESRGPRCAHPGPCDLGCPSRRRASADGSYWPRAIAAGARIQTGARVVRLECDAAGRVTAAIWRDEAGAEHRQRGTKFLLAANGIATPWLLLVSASSVQPAGLGNRSGLVGRNLMLHPYAVMFGRFGEPIGEWALGMMAGLISYQFYDSVPARGFRRGLKLQLVPGPGPLATALGGQHGPPLPWGGAHAAAFERTFEHVSGLTVCVEDLPDPDNRIALSERLTDRDGLPAPRMVYRIDANARAALDFGLARAAEVLQTAGASQLFPIPDRPDAGFHLMGTARMGHDPEQSVTDLWGRVHDVDNLYVVDASLFVTAAAVNPTHTAMALALRTADHIVTTRRS